MMNGAESLVRTAKNAGVEICFANPGTTEMPIVAAMENVAGMRTVLGLFEGVCTGAADGWGRMTGRPAATLLHLGPGLANGLANLHNARRARTPVVNWIGEHAVHHIPFDAPLTSDIEALAESVGWTRTVQSAQEMADASLKAVDTAFGSPGKVASLILPSNCQWEEGVEPLNVRSGRKASAPGSDRVREAAKLLKQGGTGILLGGDGLTERGLRAAARIAAATGCEVWVETFPARQECGGDLPCFPALPYFPEKACESLKNINSLVLAGAREPVSFFAYPDQSSRLLSDNAAVCTFADPDSEVDATEALVYLAEELGATEYPQQSRSVDPFGATDKPLTPDMLCHALATYTPENAIVVNEATTTGLTWNAVHSHNAAPHSMLFITGGAIGQGLPNALGAAIACPDRRVIAFQADGSGLYTVQSLWSMARENADITVVVCANRSYRILQIELARSGVVEPGPKAHALTDLTQPVIDWVALGKGFGIPGCSVSTGRELADALKRSFAEPGPSLIEAVLL